MCIYYFSIYFYMRYLLYTYLHGWVVTTGPPKDFRKTKTENSTTLCKV